MAKLREVSKDTLKKVSRYMDELHNGEEEVWRLFIGAMSQRIYTEAQIETFAEEISMPRGSPSAALVADLSRRNMTLDEFLRISKKIKCTKVVNLFLQTTVPVIKQNLQPTLSIKKGEDLSLSCVAECKPPPDYQWYFNNDPMPNENSPTLNISNCNASHTGVYYCVVSNPCIDDNNQSRVASRPCRVEILNVAIQENVAPQFPGGVSQITNREMRSDSSCSLTTRSVIPSQEDVVITAHPSDATCRYDEHFELKCSAKSRSGKNITFQWLSSRTKIQEDPMSTSEGTSVLKMKSKGEHIMDIQCRVSSNDTDWVTSNRAKVEINFVWFVEQPRDFHGFNGREGALECRAAGMGPIEYLWLKNENGRNTRLSEKPDICIKKEEGLLFFQSLDAEHWGYYKCQAQNDVHFATSETVKVSCEPYREKAQIAVQPSSHVCLMGLSITLYCQAVSLQPVTYQWYYNNGIIANENQDVLVLSPINKRHFGTYHCIVKSGQDTIQSEVAIVSQGVPFNDTKSWTKIQAEQHEAELTFQTADRILYAREKVALLIGNEKYSAIRPLNSPHSDVDELSKTLTSLNFKVFSFTDLKFKEIMQVLDIFVRLLDSGVYCLFYYSGHGFRHQNVDYIMPIDVTNGLNCDDCIPVNQISYRLQQTKCKVIMLLDCCREKFNETDLTAPQKPSTDKACPFYNIYTIWSCSESQPAYERKSEECSVFNRALRKALTEGKKIGDFSEEIKNYMEEHAHAKSGKAFQRPSTLIQFSPLELTLHENIMFDEKTSNATMRIREWHKRIHNIAPVTIGEEELPGIQSGEVKFEFIRTNVLRVVVKLVKRHSFPRDATYNVSLTESCQGLVLETVSSEELTKTRLKIESIITFWQNLQVHENKLESPMRIISVNFISSAGMQSSYCPVSNAETYWSFSNN